MEEKKIVYEIIISIWNIVKEYFFQKKSDEEIGIMLDKVEAEEKRFLQYGENYNLLFREIWSAFRRFYERKNSNG